MALLMNFNPSKGIHQGDPLSPFMFILVVEALGRSIKENLLKGASKGLD
jgi:hypothetical protein